MPKNNPENDRNIRIPKWLVRLLLIATVLSPIPLGTANAQDGGKEGTPPDEDYTSITSFNPEGENIAEIVTVVIGGATLRSTTNVNETNAIDTVNQGKKFIVTETIEGEFINGNSTWYQVRLDDGTFAFVHSSQVSEPEKFTISNRETFGPGLENDIYSGIPWTGEYSISLTDLENIILEPNFITINEARYPRAETPYISSIYETKAQKGLTYIDITATFAGYLGTRLIEIQPPLDSNGEVIEPLNIEKVEVIDLVITITNDGVTHNVIVSVPLCGTKTGPIGKTPQFAPTSEITDKLVPGDLASVTRTHFQELSDELLDQLERYISTLSPDEADIIKAVIAAGTVPQPNAEDFFNSIEAGNNENIYLGVISSFSIATRQ